MDIEVDFIMGGFVILEGQANQVNLSDSTIINIFEIAQVVVGLGQSGLATTATVTIIP